MHGQFAFPIQRYKYLGEEQNFWRLKGNRVEEYAGIKLQELHAYYINRLSYCEVENLVERVTGEKQLSDQGIWAEVREKVAEINQEVVNQVKPTLEHLKDQKLRVNPQINLYSPQQEEILLFEDGILVKGQKSERESGAQLPKNQEKVVVKGPTPEILPDRCSAVAKSQRWL